MSDFGKSDLGAFIRDTDKRVARKTHSPSVQFEAFCEAADRMRQRMNPDWLDGGYRKKMYPLTVWAKVERLEAENKELRAQLEGGR